MNQFIRPEVQLMLWRWREVLAGGGLAVLGLWWIFVSGGLLSWLGIAALVLAGALIFMGIQRGRFRGASGGLGSVDVDEGQVTYFGPMTGGVMPLREMDALALIRISQSPHWRLSSGDTHLHIPIDADGTDDLFDAFSSLPGLKTERMLSILKDRAAQDTVIWQRDLRGNSPVLLH
ncbi:MAG: hypothetical protein ABJL99_14640 [Aliishimia sp.]